MPNLLAHLSVFFSAPSLSEIVCISLFPCYLFPLGHASSTGTSYSYILDPWPYSSYWVFNLCFFNELIIKHSHSHFACRRLREDVNRTCHFVIPLRGPPPIRLTSERSLYSCIGCVALRAMAIRSQSSSQPPPSSFCRDMPCSSDIAHIC